MKKFIRFVCLLVLAVLLLAINGGTQANAAETIKSVAHKQAIVATYAVAPITCETATACVYDFYGGTSAPNDGYWMAKRAVNGTKWVRLTMVPGMDNSQVAPITCTQEDSCVQSYYGPGHYQMARQQDGTTWVRETLLPPSAGGVSGMLPQKIQSTPGVPRITCQYPTDCIASYYENGTMPGYWMLRNVYENGPWVRVSRVNGYDWDNTYVAPITCPYSNSCVRDHWYSMYTREGYDMLRQASGTTWVRTSQVERDGAIWH